MPTLDEMRKSRTLQQVYVDLLVAHQNTNKSEESKSELEGRVTTAKRKLFEIDTAIQAKESE